jgi:hypothetical protein
MGLTSPIHRFLEMHGECRRERDALACVRYRQDEQRKKRFKTIELIVEEWSWAPPPPRRTAESVVLVKVGFSERGRRQQVKDAGGVWNPDQQAWALRYDQALALGLRERIREDLSC